MWETLIGIGGDILSQISGGGINIRQQKQANQANYDLWQKQMEYNSPAKMRERLQSAGMNPALAYGNPTSAGQAGSPPDMKAAKVETRNPVNLQQMLATDQRKYLQAQTDNTRASTKLTEQKEKQQQLQEALTWLKLNKETVSSQDYEEMQKYYVDALKASARNQEINAEKGEIDLELWKETNQAKLNNIKKQWDVMNSQQGKIDVEKAMLDIDKYIWETYKIRPTDPWYAKIAVGIVDEVTKDLNIEGTNIALFNAIMNAFKFKGTYPIRRR